MAYSFSPNFTIPSQPSVSIPVFDVATSGFAPFAEPGTKRTITSIVAPIGKAELYSLETRRLANIYANSGIDPVLWTPTKRGVNVYAQHKSVWTAADSADATKPQYASPFEVSISIKVPNVDFLTVQNVNDELSRALGILYPNAVNALAKYLRGSVNIL